MEALEEEVLEEAEQYFKSQLEGGMFLDIPGSFHCKQIFEYNVYIYFFIMIRK